MYRTIILFLLICWLLVIQIEKTAGAKAVSGPVIPKVDTSSGSFTQATGEWRSHTNGNEVHALARQGDYIWAGSGGGVVRWDRRDGSYVKFTTADGLAGNEVRAVAVDPAGPVWFGTEDGLSRLILQNPEIAGSDNEGPDNQNWTTYTTADGLARNDVGIITLDAHGHVWAGAAGTGLSEFDGQRWKTYLLSDPHFGDYLSAIVFDSAGRMWIGDSYGAYVYDGQTPLTEPISWEGRPGNPAWVPVQPLRNQTVDTIAIDANGAMWFSLSNGFRWFDGQNWETIEFPWAGDISYATVTDLAIDSAGRLWISSRTGGFGVLTEQSWTPYTRQDGLPGDYVGDILVDERNHIWAATDGGLAEFDGQTWTPYLTQDSLPSNEFSSLVIDAAGQPWIGFGEHVSRFDGHSWQPAGPPSSLVDRHVTAMMVDAKGDIWLGSAGDSPVGGLSQFTNQSWTGYTETDGLASNRVYDIIADRQGKHVWLATQQGVSRFDPRSKAWTHFSKEDGMAGSTTTHLAVDRAGHVWAGAIVYGLSKFDGERWTDYTEIAGVADEQITALAADRSGRLWVGTWAGLSVLIPSSQEAGPGQPGNEQRWTTYSREDGLGSNQILAITVDLAGDVWVGTLAGGVSRFNGETWTTYTTADGLASNDVTAIAVGPTGTKWFATDAGISEFKDSLHVGAPLSVKITNFRDNDLGHLGSTTALAFDPAGRAWFGQGSTIHVLEGQAVTSYTLDIDGINTLAIDEQGQTWVGTNEGLSHFDGQGWDTYTTADGLAGDHINTVLSDGQGSLWVGASTGLSRFDGQHWQTDGPTEDLAGQSVNALALDREGNLWVGTAKGVSVLALSEDEEGEGENWTHYTSADGLAGDNVRAIGVDQAGQVWAGTAHDGLSRFDGLYWSSYSRAHGLSDNAIRAIGIDPANRIWLATFGGGVNLFDGRKWTVYTAADGLADNSIDLLTVDRQGRIWVGTGNEITLFEPETR